VSPRAGLVALLFQRATDAALAKREIEFRLRDRSLEAIVYPANHVEPALLAENVVIDLDVPTHAQHTRAAQQQLPPPSVSSLGGGQGRGALPLSRQQGGGRSRSNSRDRLRDSRNGKDLSFKDNEHDKEIQDDFIL
jgi:hypothetical protein